MRARTNHAPSNNVATPTTASVHSARLDDQPSFARPINASAPEPQTNRDFSKALGRALHRPALMPVPGFALRLMVGEFAETLTTGQRVIPKKAQELGYQFKYPTSDRALREIAAKS